MRPRPRLFTPSFALVCLATFLFYAAAMMQIPVLPGFLRAETGASDAAIGLFIGLFSVTAVLARPAVGRDLERRRRRTYMAAGGLVHAAAGLVYVAAPSYGLLAAGRLAHGVSVACFYTAVSTLVVDMAPAERRGEALSYFSMFLYLGLAGGPFAGLALGNHVGYWAVFAVSSLLGLACAAVSVRLREPARHTPEAVEIERRPMVNRRVLYPAGVLVFAAVGYASAINFTADFALEEGIPAGLYFPALAVTVIATRAGAGRLSDRFGRLRVAAPGLVLFAASLAVEAGARSEAALLASAVMFGAGFGVFFPSMLAFTADRVPERERGSAMATFTAAFDVGVGVGSPLLGAIKGASSYRTMFWVAAVLVVAGAALLVSGAARRVAASSRAAAAATSRADAAASGSS